MMRRSFLFLQGPHGPFFHRLGGRLAALDHSVLRVNFNAGDWLDWHGDGAIAYRGRAEDWPGHVLSLARDHHITDLVLYGDCRPLHEAAAAALRPLGIRVHVFEEGYFRPNWITLEADGVNGRTAIPREPEVIIQLAERLGWPARVGADVGHTTRRMVQQCVRHYIARGLGIGLFPHYRTHRPHNSMVEALAWLPRAGRRILRGQRVEQDGRRLLDDGAPFFLLALQLDSDAQIHWHSPFADMAAVIETTIRSFATTAPAGTRLVVKNHPLDNGLVGYAGITRRLARSLGIDNRVVFLDGGHLPTLLDHACGIVVVNSTVGLQAIHHGCPTKVLGTAIYDVPGLVDPAPLDAFWTAPKPPDQRLYRAFRTVVIGHSQYNGSFYTETGISLLLPAVTARLSGAAVLRDRVRELGPLREAAEMVAELQPILAVAIAGEAGTQRTEAQATALRICNEMVLLSEAITLLDAQGASLLAETCGLATAVRRRLEACARSNTSQTAEAKRLFRRNVAEELKMLSLLLGHLQSDIDAWPQLQIRVAKTPKQSNQQITTTLLTH